MDLVASLPAFVIAVLLISASPGPAMALILRRAALRGFSGAVATVLGLEAGLYLWALFAAAGLAALVAASEVAYLVLRVVGAGFLLYLGVRTWRSVLRERRSAGRSRGEADDAGSGRDGDAGGGRDGDAGGGRDGGGGGSVEPKRAWPAAFGEGALVMLANPKAAAFMIAFYPQFVPADRPLFATTALLALLQVVIEVAFYLTLAAIVGRAGEWFRRPVVRRRLDAVSGTVFIALGLRMAADSR